MKPRLVEVTLRFESKAHLSILRNPQTWAFQLRLAREFMKGATIDRSGIIARTAKLDTVRVVRAKRVKR